MLFGHELIKNEPEYVGRLQVPVLNCTTEKDQCFEQVYNTTWLPTQTIGMGNAERQVFLNAI